MAKTFLCSETGLLYKKRPQTKTFTVPLERAAIQPLYFTDAELYAAKGGVMLCDLELYSNYFLAAFKHYVTNQVVTFELCRWKPVFDKQKLLWVMHNFCSVTFNGIKFDMPLLNLALQGGTLDDLHEAVEKIIKFGAQPRDIEQHYGFKSMKWNVVDLIEVAPLSASLKKYGARLHANRLQDLPYDPAEPLTPHEAENTLLYCCNDLDLTGLLLKDLEPQLELRAAMSLEYGMDLRSKSDAQIAETVITSEVKALNGYWAKRPKIEEGTTFKYIVPNYIQFQTPVLKQALEIIRNSDFHIASNGSILEPATFKELKQVQVGHSCYRMGIGGLHSTEETVCYVADETTLLVDRDVSSYYPNIILNQELYPKHLGSNFLEVYRSIVKRRLDAKKAKNTVVADSLKITINGSFGKLGSKYSNLYAPDLMMQVTISGQLSLLMLIEMIELAGIPVVSGNTDGVIIKCPVDSYDTLSKVISYWESVTKFETEETRYKAVYSRDVNNYIAIKEDDKTKLKGAYSKPGLQKNPTTLICVDAVIALIVGKMPIEETIRNCKDLSKFVVVREVRGGGEKNGVYLGKVVRFYYAHKETGCINYVLSGNKVPKSEGAKPCMDLPPSLPTDVDYARYISEATEILYEIGYLKRQVQEKFF